MNEVFSNALHCSLSSKFMAPASCTFDNDSKLYYLGDSVKFNACVCSIGAFDGVHIGHQLLIREAKNDAKALNLPLVSVTFDPDPECVISDSSNFMELTPINEKVVRLFKYGADYVLVYHFTKDISNLTYSDFFNKVLIPHVHPLSVHVGSNFRIGRGGLGDSYSLKTFLADYNIDFYAHGLEEFEGSSVSSTRIRKSVLSGDIDLAHKLLNPAYPIFSGEVVKGFGRGTSLGFPTANILPKKHSTSPASGVYAGIVFVDDRAFSAAINAGKPKTFRNEGESTHILEAHLLDFDGDLYNKQVDVILVKRLRDSIKFQTIDELKEMVIQNIEDVRVLFST